MESVAPRVTPRGSSGPTSRHSRYMARALALAWRALGQTSPNPAVGAVLVNRGRIVGEGYHRRAGAPHAEVEAIRRAGANARGATLYVSLEPCNHTGRTPPCCDAVINAGISRVVSAMRDPNPRTDGRGFARLRRAGIAVTVGVLEQAARELNAPFEKAMTAGLPYTIAKIGQSLDGKTATRRGESRWITAPASRRMSHQLRSRADAILIGVNTVLQDDPLLTVRGARQRRGRPVKIIVDSRLRTPLSARCLSAASPAPTLIATTRNTGPAHRALNRRGATLLSFPARGGRVPLTRLFRRLARHGIQSVLIEGGGEVFAGALAERLVDRVMFFIAPVLIGGRSAPSSFAGAGIDRLNQAIRLDRVSCRRVGPDLCVEARVRYPGKG